MYLKKTKTMDQVTATKAKRTVVTENFLRDSKLSKKVAKVA